MTVPAKIRCDNDGGLTHWCPGCETTHTIRTRRPRGPGPSWSYNNDPEAPTLSPSVKHNWQRNGRPDEICHYFLRDGKIEFQPDCTHSMKGQTVDLPTIPIDE
jgi:hypothetical protein